MSGQFPPYSGPPPGSPVWGAAPSGPPLAAPGDPYPSTMPPPVDYPRPRRPWWLVVAALVAAVAAASGVVFWLTANRTSGPDAAAVRLNDATAQPALQRYLDALETVDVDVIARNALCGLYDAVDNRRSEEQIAKLSSDAFRSQFERARVVSIDKIVYQSPNAGQVLFTMSVLPAQRNADEREEQAVAQLLSQDGEVLVCSYLIRGSGPF